MAEVPAFRVDLEQVRDYEFMVHFDRDDLAPMIVDEPPPLGNARGPNPSRLLAIAVADCLLASLLFCLQKARLEPTAMRASVSGSVRRNESGRLRIGGMNVVIDVEGDIDPAGRFQRCATIFEDFCTVTASLKEGITITVAVRLNGEIIHSTIE